MPERAPSLWSGSARDSLVERQKCNHVDDLGFSRSAIRRTNDNPSASARAISSPATSANGRPELHPPAAPVTVVASSVSVIPTCLLGRVQSPACRRWLRRCCYGPVLRDGVVPLIHIRRRLLLMHHLFVLCSPGQLLQPPPPPHSPDLYGAVDCWESTLSARRDHRDPLEER